MDTQLPSENQIFIPIISDYGFKATFGNEANTLFLRKALQALIKSSIAIKEIKVELSKFNKRVADIQTDLEKLIYTMKTLHKTTDISQYPPFWNEDWLKRAIDELDTRKMTPDERAYFARVTAANAEAVKAEKKKIEEARLAAKTEAIKKALRRGKLTNEEIAEDNDVHLEFVLSIQKQLVINE